MVCTKVFLCFLFLATPLSSAHECISESAESDRCAEQSPDQATLLQAKVKVHEVESEYGLVNATHQEGILMLVLKWTDTSPEYISPKTGEADVMKLVYGTSADYPKGMFPGSFADMVKASSYGKLTFPKSSAKVVTVNMGTPWANEGATKCKQDDMAKRAFAKMKEQHPSVDPNQYTYRIMFLPMGPNVAFCGWVGLGDHGCGHPSSLPNKGGCTVSIRDQGPFIIAHELGHNLGLGHASGPDAAGVFQEYGDVTASMGESGRFSSYSAAARYQMGFLGIKEGEAMEWQPWSKSPFELESLSVPIHTLNKGFVGVRWACPKCVPKVQGQGYQVGGELWVSFRGDEGYSALQLDKKYQNKVYVHLARKHINKKSGTGTELWKILDAGQSFVPDNSDFAVKVCAITGDTAKVSMGKTESEAAQNCNLPSSKALPQLSCKSQTDCHGGFYCDQGTCKECKAFTSQQQCPVSKCYWTGSTCKVATPFAMSGKSATTCPSGYTYTIEEADCKAAATALGGTFVTWVPYANSGIGCIIQPDYGQVYFNSDNLNVLSQKPAGNGKDKTMYACKKASKVAVRHSSTTQCECVAPETSCRQTGSCPDDASCLASCNACKGDVSTFNPGWGGCATYAHGGSNHNFCAGDKDAKQGLYAKDVCSGCGLCS